MQIERLAPKYRRLMIIAAHLVLIIGGYVLSFCLRLDFKVDREYWRMVIKTIPLLIFVKLTFFGYCGLFSGLWRYANVDDIWKIIKTSSLASVAFIAGAILIHNIPGYPRAIFLLDWIICTGLIAGVRFATRLFRERFQPALNIKARRALVVGAGEAGVIVLRESRHNRQAGIKIVGFIDDNPAKKNLHIQGIKILGTRKDIPAVAKELDADEIIITIPSASGSEIRGILSYCQIPSVKIRIVPGFQKILSGDMEIKPRDIRPEDLLGRQTVTVNEKEIGAYLNNKTVLITGAGGSIGSALCRQIVNFNPKEMLLLDHNENDVYFLGVEFLTKYPHIRFKTIIGNIEDIGLIKHTFSLHRPQVIFHAAAHKHVPLMEENPVAAVKSNVIGSRNFIYAADHYKAERFVLISTDKAVNPTSVMGTTKKITEMILQAKAKKSKTKFMAVRFGNVLSSNGSVVPLFKKQIEEGGPVTVTHPEVRRYFMSVQEASQLVLQSGSMGRAGEIFILDMGEQIKILDLAKDLIIFYGLEPEKDIKIKFTGLRPGEKLFEETLLHSEKDKATKVDKIYIAQPDYFDPAVLRRKIRELEKNVNLMDAPGTVKKMKEIISMGMA